MSTPSQDVPLRQPARGGREARFSLTHQRNCSISPAGLAGVFAALSIVTLAIGAGFAMAGAWLVLPFAGLEVMALGVALVAQARRFGGEQEELGIGRRARAATVPGSAAGSRKAPT